MKNLLLYCSIVFFLGCSKNGGGGDPGPVPERPFSLKSISVDGVATAAGGAVPVATPRPEVLVQFAGAIDRSTAGGILWNDATGAAVPFSISYGVGDSSLALRPATDLAAFAQYRVTISASLQSVNGKSLGATSFVLLRTGAGGSDKFPRLSPNDLLTLVQRQTFKYFWDFAHPVSGLARERNTSGDVVTSGGSGMGIMVLVVGIHRNFITRAQGLERMQKVVDFLSTKADRFKGAFPHWLDGNTGKVVPFSANDNGADLVETALLMQGLLAARQFFDGADAGESTLRTNITTLWEAVDWSWFRRGGGNRLYWHWSPDKEWAMNMSVTGWNEALIVYVLAAASPTHSIPKTVYDEGWARNGAMRNGNTYYSQVLPLGPPLGGPLFFSHYSFLGLKPFGLKDQYADYEQQVKAHTLINYRYCVANPKGFAGYSDSCWGLTASDDNKVGYLAHEPQNDNGVIAPTAALSSMPYTPAESMKALEFFYYKLGDRLWKEYGFVDAFNLTDAWFAPSFLAIDQGPIIIMLENYRSGLLWNLFMQAPEVRSGLSKLGFQY